MVHKMHPTRVNAGGRGGLRHHAAAAVAGIGRETEWLRKVNKLKCL